MPQEPQQPQQQLVEAAAIEKVERKSVPLQPTNKLAKLSCRPQYVCDVEQLAPGDLQRLQLLEDVGGLLDFADREGKRQGEGGEPRAGRLSLQQRK